MAQTPKNESAKRGTEEIADEAKRVTKQAANVADEVIDRAKDTARRGLQLVDETSGAAEQVGRIAVRSSAEGSLQFGQAFTDLMAEQTRYNVKVMHELTDAVDWQEVARIQGEFLRVTLERTALLTQRYLELARSVMTATASAAEQHARNRA